MAIFILFFLENRKFEGKFLANSRFSENKAQRHYTETNKKAPIMPLTAAPIPRALCLFSLLSAFLFAAPAVHAEGALREKLRERIKERVKEGGGENGGDFAQSGRLKERLTEKLNQPIEPTGSVSEPITRPGDYTFTIEHGGLTRAYLVHVPRSYNPARATPALFAFHGGGGSMDYMAKDSFYGLTSKSEKEGFIVIYPNGYSKLGSGKFATWNAGNCCASARDNNIDDVGFVRAVVANVERQLNIDTGKIYATGMSNGGMLSHRLACEMAGTFKAIAAVAGTDGTSNCAPSQPISVLHIHARDDDHVLFDGGAGEEAFKDKSKVANFTSVPLTISRWVVRNECNPEPKRVLTVPGAYCEAYSGCKDGVKVELCVTETGGHSWPGGTKPGGKETSKYLYANDVMWDFFKSLP